MTHSRLFLAGPKLKWFMACVVWGSRQQATRMRALSTAKLLNRSCSPWVSLFWAGALWDTPNKSTWCCFNCRGQETFQYRSSDCSFLCLFCLSWGLQITTLLQFWNPVLEPRYSLSSLPFFVHLTSFCILDSILSSPAFLFFSIQDYYLHGWGSASVQKDINL